MPDASAILSSIAVALLLVIMLSFAIGTQRNVSKGNARLRWLQPALPALGQRTTLRWLGSSVVQLDFVEPLEPFREVTVLVVLEPRDVPLMWLFTRARGRRDILIFRMSLRRAPRMELEATDPAAWIKSGDAEEAAGWPTTAFPAGVVATAAPGSDAAAVVAARRAWEAIGSVSDGVWRMSIRRTVPHLELHIRPPRDDRSAPERMVGAIRDVALELVRV
jgi:hypothetical protein